MSLVPSYSDFETALRSRLHAGMTVALGDGVGQVCTLDEGDNARAMLSRVAGEVSGVRLVLGWHPVPLDGLDPHAFQEVIVLMPGWGVRAILSFPTAHFVPTRLAALSALLAGVLKPDVLITRVVERAGRLSFATEVSWQRELVNAGVPVLAVLDRNAPAADAGPPLDPGLVRVVAHSSDGPAQLPPKDPEPIHDALADAVLRFVPEGARLQYGPGQLATALLRRATTALQIDTGLLSNAVIDLERRGLLAGTPTATYLLGDRALYEWADGRPILHGISHTHDVTRLSRGAPFVAVNTAIEIDPVGQINVEGVGEKVVGGIGGHPDYCLAGSMSRGGLSIIAVPTAVNGRSPFVEQLSRPASTPASDVNIVVTETGHADLRGVDWTQRRRLLERLFAA